MFLSANRRKLRRAHHNRSREKCAPFALKDLITLDAVKTRKRNRS
jgi:hypothetical protein